MPKVNSDKMAKDFVKWLYRFDYQLHAGQQERVIEQIKSMIDNEGKKALDGLTHRLTR